MSQFVTLCPVKFLLVGDVERSQRRIALERFDGFETT